MSSARIYLLDKKAGHCCCWNQTKIHRNKPSILTDNLMNALDWDLFCNDIDKAMKFYEIPRNIFHTVQYLIFSFTICILPLAYLSTMRIIIHRLAYLIPIFLFVIVIISACLDYKYFQIAKSRIETILLEATKKQPQLLFSLHFDPLHERQQRTRRTRGKRNRHFIRQQYINVSITTQSSTVQNTVMASPLFEDQRILNNLQRNEIYHLSTLENGQLPVTTIMRPIDTVETGEAAITRAIATPVSPLVRLEGLEQVKHLLTEQEYSSKRSEILDGL